MSVVSPQGGEVKGPLYVSMYMVRVRSLINDRCLRGLNANVIIDRCVDMSVAQI